MGSISSSLSSLNDALGALATQLQKNQANNVQEFTAYKQAKPDEKISDATYIENLRPNQNRLNLFAAMPHGDNQNFYQFNVNFSGNVNFSMLTDLVDDNGNVLKSETATGLDVQIMQMRGNTPVVIADSNPGAGDNYKTYQRFQSSGVDLQAGKYVVKINRDASTSSDSNFFYSFQMAGGRYYQDFDTVEQAVPKTQGESILNFLQPDAVTGLLANSVDATSALAGMAAVPVNGASLSAGAGTSDPTTLLLSAWA